MSRTEIRAAFSLATIFCLRMLGLFMIYPVFAIYARELGGATALTIGLALGAYGLAQALLQIPFGMLSDRIGRKVVISAGLLLFAVGSVVAAVSESIYGVMLGRMLQGAGAVGSVILALAADLTRETHRTKAMALIGMTIGLSFALALVLGPVLNGWIRVPGIFWLTAVLAGVALGVNWWVVPRPTRVVVHRDAETVPGLLRRVVSDLDLLRLDFGILSLHAILTAGFLGLPHVLQTAFGLSSHDQWRIYLPTLALSVVVMVPLLVVAERYRRMKPVFVGAVAGLCASQLALMLDAHDAGAILAALVVFFSAFNVMEASLPSLVSKAAPADAKGTAMGVYSSSQFLGIFLGGTLGGWAYGVAGLTGLFGFTLAVGAAWLAVAATMRAPGHTTSYLVHVGEMDESKAAPMAARLEQVRGVIEAVVVADEGVAYLKVDRDRLDEAAVRAVAPGAAP